MGFFIRVAALVTIVLCGVFPDVLHAQANVTTYHNDNARTAQNTLETTLTPLNVNSNQFGKLFTVAVDGNVYAEPLYVSNVNIRGGTHNVVYVATGHDSVYAIDGDSGTVYWQINLIPAGQTPVVNTPAFSCTDLIPEVGITGTPVIDINTGTLYVVALSQLNGTVFQFLHAIDIQSSAEKFGGPVLIQASAPGTAEDGNGTTVKFIPSRERQRAALLLTEGHVVIAWASYCDIDPWHGWVMSYSARTLAQEAVFNPSANGNRNGVWMSGGGAAADANGNIFIVTGNGTWNGTTDFGDSIVKLGPPNSGAFPVLDYFTPYNQATLSNEDNDVASGGLVLLPTLPSGKQLLTQMGKEGKIFVVDQNNMGKNCAVQVPACSGGDPQIVQEIPHATVGIWGTPAYWNGSVYWTGGNLDGAADPVQAFSLNANGSGLLSTSPTSKTTKTFSYAGPIPSISANGASSGILWGLDNTRYQQSTCTGPTNCQVLYAFDASNLATMLYNSNQAPNNRDGPGAAIKFAVPTIANGKVYVGSKHAMSAYGLLSTSVPTAATPTFSLPAGSYGSPQTVTLSDTVSTAVIHFTVDGTTPGANSPVYGGPLQITQTTTVQAIAMANGYTDSAIAAVTYTITSSPPPTTTVDVNLSGAYNVYAIFSNGTPVTNGGMDTADYAYSENLIGSSIVWSGTTFNMGGAGVPSAVNSANLSLPAGNFSAIKLLGAAVQGNHVNQVFVVTYTDGTTDSFIQSMSDWTFPQNYPHESKALTMPYRLRVPGILNSPAYIYGYSFPINSTKIVQSLTLPKNRDIVVLAVALSSASGAPPVSPSPTFSLPAGTYGSPQSVTLSDTLSTAVIHFTVDGTTPGANSPVYGGPLQITQTTTVQAIAMANGYTNSTVVTATYTITSSPAGTPVNVNLSAVYNVYAIFSNGTPVTNGGMDTGDYAYSENLIGPSIVWSGITFNMGGAGVPSAVDSADLSLPAGNFSAIKLLGAAVQGNHVNQVFVVTYTDGTTDSFIQSMSDWTFPQNYPRESKALTMPYRLRVPGILNSPAYIYGYSFPINSAKTVKSIAAPKNRDIVLLSVVLTP
ncbi:MAG: chitobiase/beta-hexosaminidase C-terminal domain-containing protein [Pseudomonadota bacterium]|nr:chitobiase/beta-hexosaminidase C-terminal domain-containing protein [Pseudomonadota bacterium]